MTQVAKIDQDVRIDTDIDRVRQWLCFPAAKATSRPRPVQDYRVLLETRRGRLVWFAVSQRTAPDQDLMQRIAQRMDDYVEAPPTQRLAVDLYGRDDLAVRLLDDNMTDDSAWGLPGAPQRALLDAVMSGHIAGTDATRGRTAVIEALSAGLHGQIARFLGQLDPDATDVLRVGGNLTPSLYNYLAAQAKVFGVGDRHCDDFVGVALCAGQLQEFGKSGYPLAPDGCPDTTYGQRLPLFGG
jgi:hypothetical protein